MLYPTLNDLNMVQEPSSFLSFALSLFHSALLLFLQALDQVSWLPVPASTASVPVSLAPRPHPAGAGCQLL